MRLADQIDVDHLSDLVNEIDDFQNSCHAWIERLDLLESCKKL